MASYSTILFAHLSVSFVNCSLVVYLSLILDGEISMATAPALALPRLHHNVLAMAIQALGPRCINGAPSTLQ
jgi:hypothetical protein